jgi:NADH-quinone oxidoreductase subunit M
MILLWLILVPFIGGALAWVSQRINRAFPRWFALATMIVDFVLITSVWVTNAPTISFSSKATWIAQFYHAWLPQMGISFHLGLDGISLLLVALTVFLGTMAVLSSWNNKRDHEGFYHFNLLWTVAAVIGVFMAIDLFLFYFFWEIMLIPMYFIIAMWGRENKSRAAIKFFIFTQAGSLLMLLSILGLYFINGNATGTYTFDYQALIHAPLSARAAGWLMTGFFIAFAIKLGIVPFHGWLPDAYGSAPVAGSLLLAGVMAKTGAYGLVRFCLPLFAHASIHFSSIALVLSAVTILYGALLAFSQTDIKYFIAYSSMGHMGFVLMGVTIWGTMSLQGVVVLMLAHGISVCALFMLAGSLDARLNTLDLKRLGGLWADAPRFGGTFMVFALASMGLPGLGTFIGEFLIVVDTFRVSPAAAIAAAFGAVVSVIYALLLVERVFQGTKNNTVSCPDLNKRETAVFAVLLILIVWMGIYPKPFLDMSAPAIKTVRCIVGSKNADQPFFPLEHGHDAR